MCVRVRGCMFVYVHVWVFVGARTHARAPIPFHRGETCMAPIAGYIAVI